MIHGVIVPNERQEVDMDQNIGGVFSADPPSTREEVWARTFRPDTFQYNGTIDSRKEGRKARRNRKSEEISGFFTGSDQIGDPFQGRPKRQ